MFQTWMVMSVGLMMVLAAAQMTDGLECKRSSALKGKLCQNEGDIVNGEACLAMAPRCCSYSVGYINCFVNKDYKEHEVCSKKAVSLYKQLSIDSDKHDALFAVGNALSTHQVVSELHCLDICYRNHLCNAYNYQYRAGRSGLKVCEILFEVESIGKKKDFRYRMVDRNQRKVLLTSSECEKTS